MFFGENVKENVVSHSTFSPAWYAMAIYLILTTLVIMWRDIEMLGSKEIVFPRVLFILLYGANYLLRNKIRSCIPGIMILYAFTGFLYYETAYLNTLFFEKTDPLLERLDGMMFGYQPAIEFSRHFSGIFWSELFYLGYFSYYLMPLAAIFILWKFAPWKMEEFGAILILSFLTYYVLFILIPAAGPQYYYTDGRGSAPAMGMFGSIIRLIQHTGEGPTAAFPSSHVGIALIVMMYIYRHLKKYVKYYIPFFILLCFATVYIKAHWFADVIAGFVSAPIIYYIAAQIYQKIKHTNGYTD